MRKLCLITMLLCAGTAIKAQTNLDSLYAIWLDETQTDSNRAIAFKAYVWDGYLFSRVDSVFILAQSLLAFGEKQSYDNAKAMAYGLIGVAYILKADYPKALDYNQRSLEIYELVGNKVRVGNTLNNIGAIYYEQGYYPKALDYYQRSLKTFNDIGDKERMAPAISNIGNIYHIQGDIDIALEYYHRSFAINKEIGDKHGLSIALTNIGAMHAEQENFTKALEYYENSLTLTNEMGNAEGSAMALNNFGAIYKKQGDYVKALDYFQRSLTVFEEIGYQEGSAMALKNMGDVYKDQKDYPKALEYCKRALIISENIGSLFDAKDACECLYDSYKATGQGNKALVYLEKIQVIDDSLNAEETAQKLQQMEFAKQVLADSLANAEKERLIQEAHEAEVRKKNQTRNMLAGGGLFLLLIAAAIYSRLRYVRKSKAVLQVEKDRSENLLLNILPADIAAELKEKGRADARDFDMVSILFTDFKGFTAASEKLSAQELVTEINACFEAFDGIMGKYDIEKIKTIGDAYMAAGGLPVPTDGSVKNTVLAALEMQAFISKRKTDMDAKGLPAFEMRVGIHTGPVVAGIVGIKKFAYDIWGDTVNTASRMESSGDVGKVNISQATYEYLKDDADLTFENRGKVSAKGKGEMEMYFVRLKADASASGNR